MMEEHPVRLHRMHFIQITHKNPPQITPLTVDPIGRGALKELFVPAKAFPHDAPTYALPCAVVRRNPNTQFLGSKFPV